MSRDHLVILFLFPLVLTLVHGVILSSNIQKLTSESVLRLLIQLMPTNQLGQPCNPQKWNSTIGQFMTRSQYPLDNEKDWRELLSIVFPNKTSITGLCDLSTKCSAVTQRCECHDVKYVQDKGSCLGRIHSYCAQKFDMRCGFGFNCTFHRCLNPYNQSCQSNSSDPFPQVMGYCGGKDDPYLDVRRRKWPYKQFEYILQGLIVSVVSGFGLIGNLISIWVLLQPQLRSSVSYLLLGMTTMDVIYLTGQFLDTGIDYSRSYFTMTETRFVYLGYENGGSFGYSLLRKWSYFFYELGNVGSIYFTVLVSFERYIVICHSMKARTLCTKSRTIHACLFVLCFSLIFNFPKLFATAISTTPQTGGGGITMGGGKHRNSPLDRSLPNMTIHIPELMTNTTEYYIMTTPFGFSKSYNLYLQWGKIVFKYFIPFYWLIFFNFWIILELKRSDRIRQKLTNHDRGEEMVQFEDGGRTSRFGGTGIRGSHIDGIGNGGTTAGGSQASRGTNRIRKTSSTTRMMLCVVGVFGLCYLPLFIHEIFFRIPNYEPFQNPDLFRKSIQSSVIYSFVKLLATLNSSVNFIIYSVMGEKFRHVLIQSVSHLFSSFKCGKGQRSGNL